MTVTVIQKTIRGLVATGALFLLTVMGMAFLSYRLADVDYWTIHTHKVIEELKDSLSALQDVETGERGYLVTSAPEFLEPYNTGRNVAIKHIELVEKLTGDNQAQQNAVKILRHLAEEKLQTSKGSIEKVKPVASLPLSDQQRLGKKIMDTYRLQIKEMISGEEKLLAERVEQLRVTQYAVWTFTAILGLLAVALLSWVFKITRNAIEEERSRIDALNAEIDQRVKAEKALKDAALNLTRSNADLQQFAYVASHDLQEPLRAITGFLTLLTNKQGDNIDEDSKRYINHAVEGAHRMRALVNDLLTFARVESKPREFVPVALASLIPLVEKDLAVQIEENNAVVRVEGALPVVLGEATQLRQLLQNLVGNGIKFKGEKQPEITIKSQTTAHEEIISVTDNGLGFDMEHAEKIFVIFQRLQSRDKAPGTGIGLAVCKKIVERHDGRIWAESQVGKGSTFYFALPRLPGDLKA